MINGYSPKYLGGIFFVNGPEGGRVVPQCKNGLQLSRLKRIGQIESIVNFYRYSIAAVEKSPFSVDPAKSFVKMENHLNVDQNNLKCMYCGECYDSEKELKIHSFIHSDCAESILPIFHLTEVNKNSKIRNFNGKIQNHSTTFQIDSSIISDSFKKLNSLKKSKEGDSGYSSPSPPFLTKDISNKN